MTATVDRDQPDLDFFSGRLGLRLVKRTVNFDNHNVHHFYYGTERGDPGTIWTTFPYGGQSVPVGVHGTGQIVATAFSIPAGAENHWRARLEADGVRVEQRKARFGASPLALRDPSGLVVELVPDARDERPPWPGCSVSPELAIRGLHAVTLLLRDRRPTARFLTEVLGFRMVGEEGTRSRLCVSHDAPGHLVDLVESPAAPAARNGLGTVHHVAFAIDGAEGQLRLREELVRLGVEVTPVRDRTYFQSIYFREPGGVLLEVATMSPGFTVDEPLARLGQSLRLPPWEEPHRAEIEAALPPISVAG
ncbi:MAG: ring-cleaving dioxygenase [Gemmatimonadales bacterium]